MRRQTRPVAVALLTMALADGAPKRFLRLAEHDDTFQALLADIEDESLRESVSCGVGFLHEGTAPKDVHIVQQLFESNAIQVCVVPRGMCYQIEMSAYLVVVMDTQFYNGKYHVYEDYPIADMLHMVGLANRPILDSDGEF